MAMTLNQLVFRSMVKNIKHYYLYFFALIFSVTLYFSFVTLQYNQTIATTVAKSGTATLWVWRCHVYAVLYYFIFRAVCESFIYETSQ